MIATLCTLTMIDSWLVLAAPGRRTNQIGQRVDDVGMGINFQYVAIAIVAILVVAAVGWFVYRWLNGRTTAPLNNPNRMFNELCRAHELSKEDCQLLRDIAAWHDMPSPAPLFVECERFEATEMIAATKAAASINRLKTTLFKSRT